MHCYRIGDRHNKARQNCPNKEPTIQDMDGIIGIMTTNEAQIEGTGEKVNLFDYHLKTNTILFRYTTPDGRDEVVKFPLAGFCENFISLFFINSKLSVKTLFCKNIF